MKKTLLSILFLFLLLPKSYSLPGYSKNMDNCTLSYFEFCSNLDPTVSNMCPVKVNDDLKEVCVVNQTHEMLILKTCSKEIEKNCKSEEFVEIYTCLSHPKNWASMSMGCLKSLSSGHHSKQMKPHSL